MERLQRKSIEDKAPVATPVQRRAAPGGEDAAAASAASPEAGAQAGGETGGSWEADAGLMDAMGLGEGGDAAAGGETKRIPEADEGAEGETAQADQAGAAAQQGREQQAAAGGGPAKPADQESDEESGEQSGEQSEEESDEERKKRKQRKAGGGAAAAAGAVQQRSVGGAPVDSDGVHDTAAQGISGGGGSLPHLDAIQHSFGRHDVSGVQAHTDGAAAGANAAMGAEAYASGDHVAFGSGSPSLHTAAHEAAHVVQQRGGVQLKGGVGAVGDAYEQHADAVADQVVQGKSAEGLLDQMAGGSGGATGGVQRKIVQFDIKSDLRSAMDGWGTDEDAIYRRLERGTLPELQAVIADRRLMDELRDELNQGEMSRVLDALRAPLPDKLRLAMQGWGTDEEYIHRSLTTATPAELATVAADTALVNQLEGELSGDDLRTVLDKLPIPLARRLEYAVRGWGTDEAYIFQSVERAPIAEVAAVAGNAGLVAQVDDDLSGGELHRWRGLLAKRLWLEATNGPLAFRMIIGSANEMTERLRWLGDITVQRALLDVVITSSTDATLVIPAFQAYWNVETTVVNGATAWPVAVVQAVHAQMKALPSQDTRSGVWNELQLTGAANLINRAAWNGSAFIVGANAGTGSTQTVGHGTTLGADAAVGATTLKVAEPGRFAVGDTVALDRNNAANKDVGKIKTITGNDYEIDTALAHIHYTGEDLTPDDGTATREVNWLAATVRHEIAHSVETAIGGVTGFTQGIGGWWTGTNFDTWAAAMGDPWASSADPALALTDTEKGEIKDAITDCVTNQKGSLFGQGYAATHAITKYAAKQIACVVAAENCLSKGDNFYQTPAALFSRGGKRFSCSFWYKNFMYCHDSVVDARVTDYQLYAPAEFFADAYTVFYEEAGQTGVTDADLGRLVRDSTQRDWIRNNIHNRGQAPAGTTAPAPTATPGSEPTGARPGGAGYGRSSGNPGP